MSCLRGLQGSSHAAVCTAVRTSMRAIVAGLALLLPRAGGAAQEVPDSSELVEAAHAAQADFERFRQSRIPVDRDRSEGTCDERIGRICIWFGGEEEAVFPPEPPETGEARKQLIQRLGFTNQRYHDPWVLGQLVHYLVEDGRFQQAVGEARRCGLAEPWWCSALLGYTLHVQGSFAEAEAAFRDALATMPEQEHERWTSPLYIFPRDPRRAFDDLDPEEHARQWELFWRLSDPLYLVDGNDRMTDHYARLVEARNEAHADNPQGLFWEEDLEEVLIRYGRIRGWSRTLTAPPRMGMGGGRFRLQDNRQVVGHHDPWSRGYLFPVEFLASPSEVPPESWITAPREARTWYAPPYAPDFRGLESQVGRFRRGDEMLVVGAYRPAPGKGPGDRPFEEATRGDVEAALFLVPVDGGEVGEVRGEATDGVLTLTAAPGRYVSSLEVFDQDAKRAWRARQGVRQVPLTPGLVGVSDLLLLERGASLPGTLEDAIPHVRRGVRVGRGERFTVVWEVYGLQVQEPVQVTLGFTRGRPGFLQRVGEFLGVLEPDNPVEVTFSDTGPERVQTAFRAVELELPDLEPGNYTLHLRLDLPGREPAVTSRPIVVEDRG